MKPQTPNPNSQPSMERQGRSLKPFNRKSEIGNQKWPARWRAGFTLTEMLVVIGVVVLVASLTTVAVLPMMEGRALAAGARVVQSMAFQARAFAATQSKISCLWFDGSKSEIGILYWDQAYWDAQSSHTIPGPPPHPETPGEAFVNAWKRVEQPEHLPKGVRFMDQDTRTAIVEAVLPIVPIDDDSDGPGASKIDEDYYGDGDNDAPADGKTDEDPKAYYLVVFGKDGGLLNDANFGPSEPLFWPKKFPLPMNYEVRLQDPAGEKKKVIEFTFASGLVKIRDE